MSTQTYPLTSILWPREGFVQVNDSNNTRIALLSIEFMRIGRVLSWDYVHFAIQSCFTGEFVLSHHTSANDSDLLDTSIPPSPCLLQCRSIGEMPIA
jgi:hypothetical protein